MWAKIKIYKTKQEIAVDKGISVTAINNWEKSWKIVRLSIPKKNSKKEKKLWYIVAVHAIQELAKYL